MNEHSSKPPPSDLAQVVRLLEAFKNRELPGTGCAHKLPALQCALDAAVEHTGSTLGFLDEVILGVDGSAQRVGLAFSGLSWQERAALYQAAPAMRSEAAGEVETISGLVATGGELVITDDLLSHPRFRGLPPGHPPLKAFMGIPLVVDGAVVGALGLANNPVGYSREVAELLEPLTLACARTLADMKRRRAAAALSAEMEESGRLMQAILDSSPESSFVVDRNGVILKCNKTFARRRGLSVNQLVGRNIAEFAPASILGRRSEMVQRAVTQGQSVVFEDQVDGHNFLHHICPIMTPDGEVDLIAIHAADITEIRESAEALRDLESKYRRLLETTTEGVWCVDKHMVTDFVNDQMAKMLGYTAEQMLGRPLANFVHPDDLGDFNARTRQRQEGLHDLYERLLLASDGRPLPVLVSATSLRDESGAFAGAIGLVTNLAPLKAAKEAVQALALIVDAAPNAVTVHDANGRFLYANSKCIDMHGYTREEFLSLSVHDIDVPESQELYLQRVQAIQERGEATFEVGHYRKDGSVIPLEISAKPIAWHGRNALLSIGRDISERRQFEAAVRAHQRLEAIGTLASSVAHEINNPLNVVMNYTQMLLDACAHQGPYIEWIDAIMIECERMAGIVRNLLSYSRTAKDDGCLVDPLTVVECTVSLVRSSLMKRCVQISVSAHPELPRVKLRSQQIQHLLMNLIANARDAVAKLPDTANGVAQGVISISIAPADSQVLRITIQDNGLGVPQHIREHLFEPFVSGSQDKGRGGLGLFICKGIADEHGAKLSFESTPGCTSFHLDLPIPSPQRTP